MTQYISLKSRFESRFNRFKVRSTFTRIKMQVRKVETVNLNRRPASLEFMHQEMVFVITHFLKEIAHLVFFKSSQDCPDPGSVGLLNVHFPP